MNAKQHNIDEIGRLIKEGKTKVEIEKILNIPPTTFARIIKKHNLFPKLSKPPMSSEELDMIKKWRIDGISLGQISPRLKRKKKTIYNACIHNNISTDFRDERSRPWSLDEVKNLKSLIQKKYHYRDISKILHRGINGVKEKLKKLGMESAFSLKIQENKDMAKKGLKYCYICKNIKPTSNFFQWSKECRDCHQNRLLENKSKLETNNNLDTILKERLPRIKNRCIKKHLAFDIDVDFLKQVYKNQGGKCYYTGDIMSLSTNNDLTLSVDRIDSSRGYIKGNIVLCSKITNLMKNDIPVEKFFIFCRKISTKH